MKNLLTCMIRLYCQGFVGQQQNISLISQDFPSSSRIQSIYSFHLAPPIILESLITTILQVSPNHYNQSSPILY
jgi:hypothetical protein